MSGGVALQALVTGIATGIVYGLVALGFTLVYRLTRVYAFAHGDLVVGAVFVGVLVVVGSTPIARTPSAGASVALVLFILLAGAVWSGATYVVVIRPYLGVPGRGPAEVIGWVAGGIAAGLAIREGLGLAFTQQAYAVPDPLHLPSGVISLPDGAALSARTFGVLAVGFVVAVVAEQAVVRGRFGLALRAASDDPEAASLVGIPVERVVLVAFLVAGLLAGLAGILDAPGRSLSVDAGVILGLKGVTAALLGRLGSLRGALVGGVVLGVLESYAVAWPHLGAAYADVLPLGLLVVLLAARPEGLRGRIAEPVA